MSSSRSIAAARQKRAGEPSNNVNTNSSRPVTSISSQAVFAQQQQQQQQQQPRQQQINPKYNQINTNAGRQQRSGISQNQQQIPSASAQQKQLTKISLPDAIGLITLRLGKLEKFIQESMEDGSFSFMSGNNNNNDYESNNMKLVSDEVFENITTRLENLEKKNNNKANNNSNDQILKVNKDIKDIKDSINNLNTKVSSFINETQDKFLDYESALVEIEKNIGVSIDDNNYNEQENENIDDYTENIVSETIEDSVSTSGFVVDNDTLDVEDVDDEEYGEGEHGEEDEEYDQNE